MCGSALRRLEDRYPGWRVCTRPLDGFDEMIVGGARLALIDVGAYERDPDYWLAHMSVHLDLHGDDLGDEFTRVQEDEAHWLATVALGRTNGSRGHLDAEGREDTL